MQIRVRSFLGFRRWNGSVILCRVPSSTLIRLTAFLLFLVSTANFVGFDLQPSTILDIDDDRSGNPDCFACCCHVIPATVVRILVRFEPVGTCEFASVHIPSFEIPSVFHPPKG